MILVVIILFFVSIIISVVEQFLYIFFNKWYYQNGLPVIHFTVNINRNDSQVPTVEKINLTLLDSERIKFKLKEITEGKIAFREALFQWNIVNFYTPIMRGYLYYDNSNSKIEVYGLLMWNVLIGTLLFMMVSIFIVGNLLGIIIGFLLIGIYFLIITFIYSVQRRRYEEFASIISKIKS